MATLTCLGVEGRTRSAAVLGEAGENSNVWFRDAVRLLEDLGIGWAWWPLKRLRAFPRPCPSKRPQDTKHLDHGRQRPAPEVLAQAVLMDLTDKLKAEHCLVQPDVVDALMRQPHTDATLPFPGTASIPGTVFAPDYDLGVLGWPTWTRWTPRTTSATEPFTAWNNGWTGRNDGVDIESCSGVFPTTAAPWAGPKRANG